MDAFAPDVRRIRRANGATGLTRGTTAYWIEEPALGVLWNRGPDALGADVGAKLRQLGLVEPATKAGIAVDRNLVFARALCPHAPHQDPLAQLRKHHFVLVGCGGLGSNAAIALAALGARRFTLIDSDRIEEHNLNRLLWAEASAVGQDKAVGLAQVMRRRFASEVNAVTVPAGVDLLARLAAQWQPQATTVVLATDVAAASRECASWLHRHGIEYVHAGYVGPWCVTGPLVTESSDPCPFCTSSLTTVQSAGYIAPSAAPNNLLIASFLAAQLLIRCAQGANKTALHRSQWRLNLATGDSSLLPFHSNSNCEVCR